MAPTTYNLYTNELCKSIFGPTHFLSHIVISSTNKNNNNNILFWIAAYTKLRTGTENWVWTNLIQVIKEFKKRCTVGNLYISLFTKFSVVCNLNNIKANDCSNSSSNTDKLSTVLVCCVLWYVSYIFQLDYLISKIHISSCLVYFAHFSCPSLKHSSQASPDWL